MLADAKSKAESEQKRQLEKIKNGNATPSTTSPPLADPPTATMTSAAAADAVHSADFTMVKWFGEVYTFSLGVQSSAVKALWEEWEKNGLGLHQETIGNSVDAEQENFRMDTTFRKHPAWGTMIHSCGGGIYKLDRPTTKANPPASKAKKSKT